MSGIALALALGFGLAFAESGLGLGMVLPGETAVVVLAASMRSPSEMVALGVVVMFGASLGDHCGYLLGRRYGDSLRDTKVVRRLGQNHFDRASDLLRRRGGLAVFLTRLVPIVRTLTPAAAGASGLEYRRFAPASLAGSATWSTAYVGGGSVVAALTAITTDAFGRASWLLLVLLALAVVPVMIIRAVTGVRPVLAAPDVESLERDLGVTLRSSTFAPLAGDYRA
ncbi:DedA family protein [Aeromicrobium sp.]|uniref:DedA family protein n=1 Tax=Aeromicrobium sp. TaxID=1871063 RepID=UPI0019A4411F|nr:DedA family protein [Aeromicrobium sp.]MBC7633403.1 DedA family protein [Aeromicrobium sp.]